MSDACHLERIGRELKCPICLSLLDSAASLSCNHVFCNSCIQKSMKSGSDCPVCKVPYQRREIRPAPHMDNLVKVYKSMEVASGLSLFVTQNPATAKLSGAKEQAECDKNVGAQDSARNTPETAKHQRKKEPVLNKLFETKLKNSGRNRGKPSFLTNKRVQVPQSPSAETPLRQAKNELGALKMISPSLPAGHPSLNGKGSHMFSPFFWLREDGDEDDEKSSQQTEIDHFTGSPAKAPSFSDIKDSDDEMPTKTCLNEETRKRCNDGHLFDSEIFEWTQRPCSPELCSSPANMEDMVETASEFDSRLKEVEGSSKGLLCKGVVTGHLDNVNSQKNSIRDNEPHNSSSPGSKSDDKQNGNVIPYKRGRKFSNKGSAKSSKKPMGQVKEAFDGWETDEFLLGQRNDSELVLGSSQGSSPKSKCVESSDPMVLDEANDHVVSKLSGCSDSKRDSSIDKKMKKDVNSDRQNSGVGAGRQKQRKQNLVMPHTADKVIASQRFEDTSKSYLCMGTSVEKIHSCKRRSTCCMANSNKKRNCQQMRFGVEDEVSELNFCREEVEGNVDMYLNGAPEAEGFPIADDIKGSLKKGEDHPQRGMPILQKCDENSIKCAFCHSTEETEASGEMVHFFKGRPVSDSHSAGPVIHSHRNCTEWAPNVYFEDDIAINLEEELARSRRIKCSLCGRKGAALGCYEKSCRKSFHVPCAKTLRPCRWDNDHFVILCPLHASSKLPCKLSTFRLKKGNHNKKGKNLHLQPQVIVSRDVNRNSCNFGGSSAKLVVCCSGLSSADKETVSQFAKASGAVISANWKPSVTHVIASVDENEACRRTLKVLMGILEGRWILSIKWVQACMKALGLVDEAPYEISCIHGIKNGPYLGRLRLLNKQPKLFANYKFYLSGDFAPSYKGYLQDLLIAAGGTILQRRPIAECEDNATFVPPTVIIYCVELPKKDMILALRRSNAGALAVSSGSKVATNLWVLDCIAGHKVQDL